MSKSRPLTIDTPRQIMAAIGWSLREPYRTLEAPVANPFRDARAALDAAVRADYGTNEKEAPSPCASASNWDWLVSGCVGVV